MCNDCPICIAPLFPANKNIMRLKKKVLVRRGERLPITKLKCGHTFHSECIKKWFLKTDVDASDKCPMCRDKIRFKKHSKDFMMNKLRWNDPFFEYGDEDLYEVDSESEYSDSGSEGSEGSEESSDWQEAWDEVVSTLQEDTGHDDLSIPLGEDWADIITRYLHGGVSRSDVWDIVDGESEDSEAWEAGEIAWDSAVREMSRRE